MINHDEQKRKDEGEIAQRRDEALRRALNTPPKQNKDLKKGNWKPQANASAASRKGGS